jgi:hypothetical protein
LRRISVLIISGAVAVAALSAGPAGAAPSNKNTEVIRADCGGRAITISVVHKDNENADLVSAGPVVGGGSTKVASFTAFAPGTTTAIFSAESHYGGPVNAECSGTITEGGATFDFVALVHLVGV